jgi:hypothetical protein
MFLLNGKPLAVDTAFTTADGTQYPANWLRLSTTKEKQAIGITEVADPVRADDRYYWGGDLKNPKALEDKPEFKQDGTPLYVQKYNPVTEQMEDTNKQVITKGLKSNFISQVKATAGSILAQSDWMVIRKAERDVDLPTVMADYRASIVSKADELEAKIKAVKSVEELASLDLSFPSLEK